MSPSETSKMDDFSSALSSRRPPLPEEVVALTEEETACRFCGISYLILTKVEKMEERLKMLQGELEKFKTYAEERPGLVSKLEKLEDLNTRQQRENVTIVSQLSSAAETNETLRQENIAFNERLEITKRQMIEKERNLSERQSDMQKKNLGILRGLREAKERLNIEGSQIRMSVSSFRQQFQVLCADAIQETMQALVQYFRLERDREIDKVTKKANGELEEARTRMRMLQIERDSLASQRDSMSSLVNELRVKEKEYQESFELQASRITRENEDLKLQLTAERTAFQNIRAALDNRCKELDAMEKTNQNAQRKIQVLEEDLELGKRSLQECCEQKTILERQIEDIARGGGKAMENASKSMAEKDEKIHHLEKSNRETRDLISKLNADRQATIDAHQSRIRQLQEHFQLQLKTAGEDEARKTEERLHIQHEQILQTKISEISIAFTKESNRERERYLCDMRKLQQDLEAVQLSKDADHADMVLRRNESEALWRKKMGDMQSEMTKLKVISKETEESLNAHVRTLQQKISLVKNDLSSQRQSSTDLSEKSAEVSRLKETVKIECEERIRLVGELEKWKKMANNVVETNGAGIDGIKKGEKLDRVNQSDTNIAKERYSTSVWKPRSGNGHVPESPDSPDLQSRMSNRSALGSGGVRAKFDPRSPTPPLPQTTSMPALISPTNSGKCFQPKVYSKVSEEERNFNMVSSLRRASKKFGSNAGVHSGGNGSPGMRGVR